MRMPIFSYFLVVGAVLTGLLIWLGDDGDLQSAPMRTSQQIGIPKPFKGKPETMVDISNANFAAAHEAPAAERAPERPAKVAAEPKPRKHRTVARARQPNGEPNWQTSWQSGWAPAARSAFAEYPRNNPFGFH